MSECYSQQKPLVGFFPPFVNLAETGRAVMIAKRYREMGGSAIFFSHGGKYEFLAQDNGFQIVRVKPDHTDEKIEEFFKIISLETIHAKSLLNEEWIMENVKEEIDAYKKKKIKLLLSTNNLTCSISARAAGIPYVNIVPGVGSFALKIPDPLENIFTRLIPQFFKIKIFNWFASRTKLHLKSINKIAKKVGVPPFKRVLDVWLGDYTYATSNLEFINVFPNQQNLPAESYKSMILLDELFVDSVHNDDAKKIDEEIETHLKKQGKLILVTLGSSGTKEIFLRILKTLNKTNYNVVAIYTSILDENNLPDLNDNILLKKFVPSISKVNRMVDLAITHGGQGTVYTAVYSKKPVIGIPMHMEQHLNLEKLVGHGTGIMLSKKYFSERKLMDAINEIFNNYDIYLSNAQKLAEKIPPSNGDKKIAQKIFELINN